MIAITTNSSIKVNASGCRGLNFIEVSHKKRAKTGVGENGGRRKNKSTRQDCRGVCILVRPGYDHIQEGGSAGRDEMIGDTPRLDKLDPELFTEPSPSDYTIFARYSSGEACRSAIARRQASICAKSVDSEGKVLDFDVTDIAASSSARVRGTCHQVLWKNALKCRL
jgi:hypothetical protein